MSERFVCHSDKQERALRSEADIVVAATGIQWGKTTLGAVKLKRLMHRYTDDSDNFLLLSPTYKVMQQSSLPPFLRLMFGCGNYNKTDGVFEMHGGGRCWMRTGTDPDAIVGITNVRGIWGDEAGLYTRYFWENILARAAFRSAQIILTTSPYTLNWLYTDIIRPKLKDPKALPHVEYIAAASNENPYFPQDVYDRNRATMDPRRFNAMFGGKWERMAGLVYSCFDEDENICEPFALPAGTRFFGGVDWGFTAPCAITVRAITPTGHHFQVAEVYRTGMTLTDKIEACRLLRKVWAIERFYCDPEEPASIEEFNRAGLSAIAANNDVKLGIALHYELIKTRRYRVFSRGCSNTIDEYATYHYPEPKDSKPDQDVIDDDPVSQSNHAMDSNRYITVMTRSIGSDRRTPFVPEDRRPNPDTLNPHARIQRIRKPIRRDKGTEDWS